MWGKMKIDSWKKATINGILFRIIYFAVFIVCICLLTGFVLQGESFSDHPADQIVNGISFQFAFYCYVVIALIIPIIIVRYTRIKYLLFNILLYFFTYFCLGIIFLLSILFFEIDLPKLISVRYFIEMGDFCLLAFPTGLFFGTVIAIIINTIRNKVMF